MKGPKSNKLNLEHLEHFNVTLHDLKGHISVVWFHFFSLLLGSSEPSHLEASRHPPSHLRVRHSAFQIAAHHSYLDRDRVIGYGDLHGDRGSFRNDSITKLIGRLTMTSSNGMSSILRLVSVLQEHLPTPKICLLCKDCRKSLTPAFNN